MEAVVTLLPSLTGPAYSISDSCSKSTRDLNPEHAQEMDQCPLHQHIVFEKVQLEHQLCLGPLLVGDCAIDGRIVSVGKKGELPLESANNLGVPRQLGPRRWYAV